MFEMKYLKNVSTLQLDQNKCNGCKMCINVCPHAVFTMEAKRAKIVDLDACMECGACSMNCPENAISVLSGLGCGCATMVHYRGVLSKTRHNVELCNTIVHIAA